MNPWSLGPQLAIVDKAYVESHIAMSIRNQMPRNSAYVGLRITHPAYRCRNIDMFGTI